MKSPCRWGQKASDNKNIDKLTFHCGLFSFQNKLHPNIFNLKVNEDIADCCRDHDKCYSTCGYPNFKAHKKLCDLKFTGCIDIKCRGLLKCMTVDCQGKVDNMDMVNEGMIRNINCAAVHREMVKILELVGHIPFNAAQKKHCVCTSK